MSKHSSFPEKQSVTQPGNWHELKLPEVYTKQHRSNDVVSGMIHTFGLLTALYGLYILVTDLGPNHSSTHHIGFWVFGLGSSFMFLGSSLYHLSPGNKEVLNRLDHCIIYICIASTYTSLCLIALDGWWRMGMLTTVYIMAIFGIGIKATGYKVSRIFSVGFYVFMGAFIVVAYVPMNRVIPDNGLHWLLIGGGFYTLGAVVYACEYVVEYQPKYFGMHEAFHILVWGGYASHWYMHYAFLSRVP